MIVFSRIVVEEGTKRRKNVITRNKVNDGSAIYDVCKLISVRLKKLKDR